MDSLTQNKRELHKELCHVYPYLIYTYGANGVC